MPKKFIIFAVIAAVLAGGGYYAWSNFGNSRQVKYVTEPAKVGDIVSSVSATGRLKPKVSVLVGTEVSGTIREIYVNFNSAVRKGQVLLKLDQDTFRTQVEQARASLANARAKLSEMQSGRGIQTSSVKTNIAEAKATLDKAEADYKRKETLYGRGIVSREELDNATQAYMVAKSKYEQTQAETAKTEVTDAQIASARAMVGQARAALKQAETNLAKTVIRSPMDGMVINRTAEVGQTVAASFSTPNLFEVGELQIMQVEVSIDEADVGQVQVGQKAEFTVDAFPVKVFEGKVAEIYYAPVTVQNVVTYSGIIEVENPERILRPGMTANVKIITSTKKGVLLVPNSALRVKLDQSGSDKKSKAAPGGMKTVWVLKDKKPQAAKVKLGVTDFINTEIISGLNEGDRVIVDTVGKSAGANGRASGGGRGGHGMRF